MIKAVELKNKDGFILRGILDFPKGATKIVVMLHGFTGNKTEHAGHFRNLARRLSSENIASVRFDYHGNGESDGEFSDFVFENALDDGRRILDYARNMKGIEKVILLGFSLGGAISSLIASDKTEDALVLWSPAGSMKEHARLRFDKAVKLENGNAFFAGFEFSEKFVTSIEKYDLYQNVSKYNNDVIILHGDSDKTVLPEITKKYLEGYKNCSRIMVEGAGHGYDRYNEREKLYFSTIDFIKKH